MVYIGCTIPKKKENVEFNKRVFSKISLKLIIDHVCYQSNRQYRIIVQFIRNMHLKAWFCILLLDKYCFEKLIILCC